jgi:hypothetical protein
VFENLADFAELNGCCLQEQLKGIIITWAYLFHRRQTKQLHRSGKDLKLAHSAFSSARIYVTI